MPQSTGKVAHAGAKIIRPSPKSPLCKTWREEAEAWCKGGKKPGERQRNFNKRFYDNLKDNNPNLYNKFDPEIPVGIIDKSTGDVVHVMHDLSAAGDPRAAAVMATWGALATRYRGVGKAVAGKGMCSGLNARIRGQFGKNYTGLHADGRLKNGTNVEIKGPGDSERPNQFENEKKCSKSGKVLVIDHEACDPHGDITTPGGNCKAAG